MTGRHHRRRPPAAGYIAAVLIVISSAPVNVLMVAHSGLPPVLLVLACVAYCSAAGLTAAAVIDRTRAGR